MRNMTKPTVQFLLQFYTFSQLNFQAHKPNRICMCILNINCGAVLLLPIVVIIKTDRPMTCKQHIIK